jgi:hypothetical protein
LVVGNSLGGKAFVAREELLRRTDRDCEERRNRNFRRAEKSSLSAEERDFVAERFGSMKSVLSFILPQSALR